MTHCWQGSGPLMTWGFFLLLQVDVQFTKHLLRSGLKGIDWVIVPVNQQIGTVLHALGMFKCSQTEKVEHQGLIHPEALGILLGFRDHYSMAYFVYTRRPDEAKRGPGIAHENLQHNVHACPNDRRRLLILQQQVELVLT